MFFTKIMILSSFIYNCSPFYKITNVNNAFIKYPNKLLISHSLESHKIGIVDFRYILKQSNAMKTLGNKFLLFEKKINEKFKRKQIDLKKKEKMIKKNKVILTETEYLKKMKIFKEDVFKVQKKYKNERSILNRSFQQIQKKIKDLLDIRKFVGEFKILLFFCIIIDEVTLLLIILDKIKRLIESICNSVFEKKSKACSNRKLKIFFNIIILAL